MCNEEALFLSSETVSGASMIYSVLGILSVDVMRMQLKPTLSSETSAFILRTPGKFPKEYRLHSEHGESLKTTSKIMF